MAGNKRKFDWSADTESILSGCDAVLVTSFNFHPFSWGFRLGDSQLRIIRRSTCHQIFRLVPISKSSYGFQAQGGYGHNKWLFVDENSRELILSSDKSQFRVDVSDVIGEKVLVTIQTKHNLFIRHSNHVLRADPDDENDRPFRDDSLWWFQRAKSVAPPAPPDDVENLGFKRPLFIHLQDCILGDLEKVNILNALRFYVDSLDKSERPSRISKNSKLVSYPLQGAGGMGAAKATAISMHRPGKAVSSEMRGRIESATTVKSRGGMDSFISPSNEVARAVARLSSVALKEMKRMHMFGLVSNRDFDLELGFCEWVILPYESEILPHRDGGSDCDVAAIFGVRNRAVCTVEGTSVTLDEGDMYIFEPQKYTHSVAHPQMEGPREVLALRFFRSFK